MKKRAKKPGSPSIDHRQQKISGSDGERGSIITNLRRNESGTSRLGGVWDGKGATKGRGRICKKSKTTDSNFCGGKN